MNEEPKEIKPQKEINLILGQGRVVSVEDDQQKKKAKVFRLAGVGGLSLILLATLFIGWQSAAPPPSKIEPKVVSKTKEPETTTYDANDPVFWPTYTDAVNLFSLKYPRGTTIGKRPDNPFPVAVALKFGDAVVEVTPGAEKPGWLLTVSTIQANDKKLALKDWAKEANLDLADSAVETSLADLPALTWQSAIYPEAYYLVRRAEGVVFIKSIVNSQQAIKHKETIAKVLATLKFFKKENDPDLGLKWGRRQFGSAWDVEYPEGWTVDEGGKASGAIRFEGQLGVGRVQASFSYPSFNSVGGIPASLNDWVESELTKLSADQRAAVVVEDVKMGGAEAKKMTNFNGAARLYLWKRAGRNPSLIVVSQTEGEYDSAQMAQLLDRFIAGLK